MATQKSNPVKAAQPNSSSVKFLLSKENYMIIGGGVLLLIIGYFMMSGGEQKPNEYKVEEIYSFRRVTLAPITVMIGYIVIGFGIMSKPKD